jgi:ubiquitin-protein ligase
VPELKQQSWIEAEPGLLEREQSEMAKHAPEMSWREDLEYLMRPVVGWVGKAPAWSAERMKPAGVDELLAGRQLELTVFYPEGFPMASPTLLPLDPEVPIERRTLHRWHVNGDGTLCLIQRADDWQPTDTAADLVRKASGWFIEYLLVEGGRREAMTERGIFEDAAVDELLASLA